MRILAAALSLYAVVALPQGDANPIGWRFTIEWDVAREYIPSEGVLGAPRGRPVTITLWYPATDGGTAATLADLARLGAYQRFAEPPMGAFDEAIAQAVKDTSAASLDGPTRARRDAPPRGSKQPLILFAHATPLAQVTMAEYLAAQGFVVAGLMSRGATSGAYRLSVEDVRAMSEDLEFALGRLQSLPNVDTTRVGVIGMSNGALGAVGVANRARVRAIVSLDGTVGEQAAARVLPALVNANTPVSNPPLLHLYTTPNSYLSFSELQKRTSQCVTVKIPDIRHADFLSYAFLKPPAAGEEPTRASVVDKFGAIQRLTRQFLSQLMVASEKTARLDITGAEAALGLALAPCATVPAANW